ncbi:Peroxisomal acyl-coenzyme A oxidase 1 [Camellia lanceoleosa]|uniref:Peroxisomal acyl-coenzyme A oxidase 1 n=1 Tax=Camellia lanceoleosa TaxID=1840588 RepID=A0ACC0GD68_9ERIC|nr:Peroxisomal acyl-coenzyme A oxidase 1 [Camellia lanceoleosa]
MALDIVVYASLDFVATPTFLDPKDTKDGIEDCRKLCGSHGYLCTSGLPELFAVYVPACTYEGDNIVLLLQLGSGKKPVGTTSYMGQIEHLMQCRSNVQRAEDWLKPSAILEAFESRALECLIARAQNLTKFTNPFIEKLLQDIPGWGVREQLEALCNIYALFLLHKHQGDFLFTSCITAKQASLANDQLRSLYSQVRPNAIALVDAFNYTDHFLGSILGCYDGNFSNGAQSKVPTFLGGLSVSVCLVAAVVSLALALMIVPRQVMPWTGVTMIVAVLVMDFIATNSPPILPLNQKCGLRIGLDGFFRLAVFVPYCTVEDIAFDVTRFFQMREPSKIIICTMVGLTLADQLVDLFIATSYDYDAPIDEYVRTITSLITSIGCGCP